MSNATPLLRMASADSTDRLETVTRFAEIEV
jgi:hypothetical protein